ncbi:MAG: hypothetical protein Q4D44_05085 [Eubacteriales bacterium]|nr:hypothetical protein [Eubacteriales bacterium]
MSAEKIIKLQAKTALKNNYTSALIAFFCSITAFVSAVFLASASYTTAEILFDEVFANIGALAFLKDYAEIFENAAYYITLAILLPLTLPLHLGVLRYFYTLVKYGESSLREVFYYIGKRFFKALGFCFSFFFRCLFRVILPLLPGIVLFTINDITTAETELALLDHLWYFISYTLLITGTVPALRLCSNYFLAPFVFFENPDAESKELWREAKLSVKPLRTSVNKLITSVSPLFLLCVFIIPIIYVVPYILTCFSISAKWILELKNASKEE